MNQVSYEWDIETTDDDGDIEDHLQSDEIPTRKLEKNESLVLVRDHPIEGRSWAYVKDGKLSPYFIDAYDKSVSDVPKRFHLEFGKSIHASK